MISKRYVLCLLVIIIFLAGSEVSAVDIVKVDSKIGMEKKTDNKITQNTKINITVDVSHGYEVFIPAKASAMGAVLESTNHYHVTGIIGGEINESILSHTDIFILMYPDPSIPYKTSELDALKTYWDNGGSILFVGSIQSGESIRENTELNRIIDELGFNITFSTSQADYAVGLNENLPVHDLTYMLESIYLRGASIDITNENSELTTVIADGNNGNPGYVAWNNSEKRAAFLGSYIRLLEFSESTFQYDPNWNNHTNQYQFQYNLMNWLGKRDPQLLNSSTYNPIKVYTGESNPNTISELKSLSIYKGICHTHIQNDVSVDLGTYTSSAEELEYDFIVATDYNTIEGAQVLRQYFQSHNIDINVITGEESTGLGQYHVVGWGLTEDIEGILNPQERIELYHNQSSPAVLCHPSWLISPDFPRIWDHKQYPFDGYETINSGFLQGCGNLAEYPFYAATDSHTGDISDVGRTWNYVLADEISDEAGWWTEVFEKRRSIGYIPKDNLYFGDKLILDEILGRFTDSEGPNIELTSPNELIGGEEATFTAIVTDDSRINEVSLVVKVNNEVTSNYDLERDENDYSLFQNMIGPFESGQTVKLVVTASDEHGHSSSTETELIVTEAPSSSVTSSSSLSSELSTGSSASGYALTVFLPTILMYVVFRKKRK